VTVRAPHSLAAALCIGIAAANAARLTAPALAFGAVALVAAATLVAGERRVVALAVALALAGWWWGSVRLTSLDRSVLATEVGTAQRARLEVTASARHSRYHVRVPVVVVRFGARPVHEPALLQLPPGRAPPQGAIVSSIVTVDQPRGPDRGFDERQWLTRKGVHVVLRADTWRRAGSRGGLGGLADQLRARVERPIVRGTSGERRAVLAGVVLGDDQAVSDHLRDRFRRSGLYHLLAVSGENVTLVAVGALMLAWLLEVPRLLGEVVALAGIAAYVLAVGPQPSVIRAGVVLLGWNPYTLLDAGFQLSFAAVAAIFIGVAPLLRVLEGYPLPDKLAETIAVSTVCAAATAPVLWLQFHAVPLLAVPANALAAPAMAPLLALALLASVVDPIAPGVAALLTGLAGWCAAWLALCARTVGSLPFAQVSSNRGGLAVGTAALVGAAYAWRRCPSSSRST
jgi:competence protein ComEC